MVDSVNGVGAVSNSTYNISFEELDANKDGKVDKNDYDLLKGYITDDDESNDLKITTDELDKIFEPVLNGEETELEDCPDCVPQDETEGAGAKTGESDEITVENANDKAAALLGDDTRKGIDPKTAKTADELKAIQDKLTAQIAEYDAVEKVLLEKIEKLQSTLAALNNEAKDEEKDYEETADDANKKSQQINDKVNTAEAKAEEQAEATKAESNKTAEQCLADYKAGKYGDESLSSVLNRELALKVGDGAKAGTDEIEEAKQLSNEVEDLSSQLTQIEGNIDELKTQAAGETTELTTTISNRDGVLAARQADSDKFQATYEVEVEGDEPEPEKKGCCDPITFTKGDMKYDFIQDRDNDGVFDDAKEFLGAENGWDEMKAYDADGNGKIEGDELKEMKMVAVDQKTGKYTFTTAAEAGVSSIDLSTYKEDGSTKKSGDKLEGTFKVNIGGEEVDAEQTTDTAINLTNKYGELFGKEIKDYGETFESNPFSSTFEANVNANLLAKQANDAADEGEENVNDAAEDGANAAEDAKDQPNVTPENEEEKPADETPAETDNPESKVAMQPKKIEE